MPRYFYVYHLPASYQTPGWHYAYYELGMPLHSYPDSCLYHPIYVYCIKHDEYMDVDYFYSRQRRSKINKLFRGIATALKKISPGGGSRVGPLWSPPSRYPPTRISGGGIGCFAE